MKGAIITVLISALLLVGLVFAISKGNTDLEKTKDEILKQREDDRIVFQGGTEVVLVQYSDFECSACANYYPVVKELQTKYADQITVIFRYFPLPMHPYSFAAAYAAEAAGIQGKFVEMHDLLFAQKEQWWSNEDYNSVFEGFAQELGLDVAKFKTDIESDQVKDRVNIDYNDALKMNLNGTPSFFLNGKQIANPASLEEFESKVSEIINNS